MLNSDCENDMKMMLATLFTIAPLAATVEAQTYAVLHSFSEAPPRPPYTNSDGLGPQGLVLSGVTLYGATESGGSHGIGTVFKVNTDGTGFMVLKTFTDFRGVVANDGVKPTAGLLLSGSTLYGATEQGGSTGSGTVFKINTNGTGFSVIKNFNSNADSVYRESIEAYTNSDGERPNGDLALCGSTLYGTTQAGGGSGAGTVFKVNTDGTEFAVLHHFTTRGGGAGPQAGVVLSGSTLYGTTGGSDATIFKLKTNGTGHTVLFRFGSTHSLGAHLVVSGNTLYGTVEQGVDAMVFQLNTDGRGFRSWRLGNTDQAKVGGLVLSGNSLYGAMEEGVKGTIFEVQTDGTRFTALKTFPTSDWRHGYNTALALSGSTLYGTATGSRGSGSDVIFRIGLPTAPAPAIQPSATVAKPKTDPFTVLHYFARYDEEGSDPGGLVLSGRTLYGTAASGGVDHGTLFKVNTDGSGFTVLNYFTNLGGGGLPKGGILLSGNTLYGTTIDLSEDSFGAVYRVNTDGTGFTVLKKFSGGRLHSDGITILNKDGVAPQALVLSDSTLYGATGAGGDSGHGTLFKMNLSGSGFTVLRHFSDRDGPPNEGLLLSGSTLYGTTERGGESESGTVFKVSTEGKDYTVLKHFSGPDGEEPMAGLVLSGKTLYGTTCRGGSANGGTVFKINTDGTGFRVLKSFDWEGSDGAIPHAGLVLSGRTLYGTTSGADGRTVVFQLNIDGTGYRVLHKFSQSDGQRPESRFVLSGNTLYGTAEAGGLGHGVVFRIELTSPVK